MKCEPNISSSISAEDLVGKSQIGEFCERFAQVGLDEFSNHDRDVFLFGSFGWSVLLHPIADCGQFALGAQPTGAGILGDAIL